MTVPPAVETKELTVAYGAIRVLESIDLAIPRQVIMGLMGPNGAGKSTLLKSILELVPRRSGQISVLGQPYSSNRQQIGYIPQRSAIDWDFPVTVGELVMMGSYGRLGWIRRPGKKEKRETEIALERLGIQKLAKRQIGELSGGQQQRAFLARAFVQDSPIYFLDEPFTGLDMTTEQTIVQLLREMRDAGKTIVIVQHDLNAVDGFFDEVTLLNRKVISSGPINKSLTEANIQATYRTIADLQPGPGGDPTLHTG